MGKSTISTGPFSIAMLVHQRVSFTVSVDCWFGLPIIQLTRFLYQRCQRVGLIIHCKLYGLSFEVSADHIKDALVMNELESSQLLQARKSWNLHMKRLQSFLSDHQQRDGPVRHGWHLMAFVGWQPGSAWAGTLALRVWAEASLPRWPCRCTSWRPCGEDSWIVTGSSSLSGVKPWSCYWKFQTFQSTC